MFVSIFAVLPLFNQGFFPMHDDTQPSRVFEFSKQLSAGVIPVRWVPDLGYGYGYPIFNFYAPLAYYIGGFVSIFGIGAIDSTKVIMVLGFIGSSITMYFLGKEFFGKKGGIISAIFYLYAPYHAVQLYVRGDIAEFWAYAFIPLAFLGAYKIFKNEKTQGLIIGSVGFCGVILSHNLSAIMLSPFLILFMGYLLFESKNKAALSKYFGFLIILGLLLSAFYWLPAVTEAKYTNVLSQIGGSADFHNHFVCPVQLWESQWGFGGSAPGCIDGISFRLGKLHILFSAIALAISVYLYKKEKEKNKLTLFLCICLLLSVFLTLQPSQFIWDNFPYFSYLQYPWRFLVFASFFSSLLAGAVFSQLKSLIDDKRIVKGAFLATIALVFAVYLKLFSPQYLNQKTDVDYTSKQNLNWNISKISDEYLPKNIHKPKSPNDVFSGIVAYVPTAKIITVENQKILFENAKKPDAIWFSQTSIEDTSNIVTLAGILVIILVIIGRMPLL